MTFPFKSLTVWKKEHRFLNQQIVICWPPCVVCKSSTMRPVVTLFSVFAIVLATMLAHVGGAMAMEGMTDPSTMAEMNMGTADSPVCPPEMCAKMKVCIAASAPVAAVAPAMNAFGFEHGITTAQLVLYLPDWHDAVSGHGLRRPPKFI